MLVEAELTVVVADLAPVEAVLGRRAAPEHCLYADIYYDWPDHGMHAAGYELRLRTITMAGHTRVVLTYKQPAIDDSGSKPEYETVVADPAPIDTMLRGLGLVELVAFEKHCTNYRFTDADRALVATTVTIEALPGQTFLELESMADPADVPATLAVLRSTLADLGLGDATLSTQCYPDRVIQARSSR